MNIFIKVFYVPLILCLLHNNLTISINWTEDNKISDINEPESIESTMCPNEFQDFCNKKSTSLENLFRIFFKKKYDTTKISKNKRVSLPTLHESSPLNSVPCQCGMYFTSMNLGSSVYPRSIEVGVCKKNTCGVFHRCQHKKYSMPILRRKETDGEPSIELQEIYEPVFPNSLQKDWVPDYINIVVGCECVPKKM